MRHAIKKQIIELTLYDRQNAFQVQNEMSSLYWNTILPEVEKVFDQLAGEGDFIRIDKLEIQLGTIPKDGFSSSQHHTDLAPGIISKIKDQVTDKVNKRSIRISSGPADQWMYYMEHGHLDWATGVVDDSWNQLVIETFATNSRSIITLRHLINKNERALQRIVSRHNEEFLKRLAEVLTAQNQDELIQFIRELSELINVGAAKGNNLETSVTQRRIWREIILIGSGRHGNLAARKVAGIVLELLVKDKPTQLKIHSSKLDQFPYLRRLVSEKPFQKIADVPEASTDRLLKTAKEQEKGTMEQLETSLTEEGIFADNAGVVLLHPFLTSLFNRLSLINDRLFVSEDSKQRALYILNYLATGNEDPEEYQLVVPKFLLGYPIDDFITPVMLNESEKREANYLLEAAIEKWSILGNTSISTLQGSFLQRKGKLYSKDGKVYLQVEPASIDMLLDHLPWNLGILKLPWMKEILRVEWR